MAKIVNVTDVPEMPGAGLLHFDDGRPPLMALPEIAQEHRERLGLTDDQRLAANDKPAGDSKPDAGGGFFGKLWNGQLGWQGVPDKGERQRQAAAEHNANEKRLANDRTEAGVPPAPLEPIGPRIAALARGFAPPATAAPAPPDAAPESPEPQQEQGHAPGQASAPADPYQQARDAAAGRAADELMNGKVVQGGPYRPAGYSPSTRKVTTEAGPAYDTRAAGERIDAGSAVLDAQLSQMNAKKQMADAAASRAAADNLAAQQSVADQAAELQRKKAAYAKQNQGLENELARYTQEAAPDPNRFFNNRSAVANIFSAIGQGLGAFGASLNHTQNFAFDYVQNQIKADIAAQEEQFRAGRADRANALARFAEYYHGDLDMAKQALTIAMNKVAQTETEKFAAQSQSKEISAAAPVLAAQFQQQQLLNEQAKQELAMGKQTVVDEDKYHEAQGGGSYRRPLTDAESKSALGLLPQTGKDQGALGLSAQGVARQKALYSSKIEPLASFADSLSHRATLMGIHFDPKTGELTNDKGKPAREEDLNVPVGAGAVGKHISSDWLTPKAKELQRAEENSVRLHAAAVYNHSISAEEGAEEVNKTIGSTDAAKLANMRYLAEEYRKRKLAIDTGAASIDPRLVNERDAAERAVNYARATGTPLAGPVPRTGGASVDVDDGAVGDGEGPQ